MSNQLTWRCPQALNPADSNGDRPGWCWGAAETYASPRLARCKCKGGACRSNHHARKSGIVYLYIVKISVCFSRGGLSTCSWSEYYILVTYSWPNSELTAVLALKVDFSEIPEMIQIAHFLSIIFTLLQKRHFFVRAPPDRTPTPNLQFCAFLPKTYKV